MGTKCLIAVIDHEGDGHYIRCHVDGYPEWVGRLLMTYYPTRQKALDVIGMGDFSSLGKRLEPRLEPTIAGEDVIDIEGSVAHFRDWGGDWDEVGPRNLPRGFVEFDEILKDSDCHYGYAYVGKSWLVCKRTDLTWIPLQRVTLREDMPNPLEYPKPELVDEGKPYKECTIKELKQDFILLGKTPNRITVKKREMIVKEVRRRGLNHHEAFAD